MRRLQIGKKKWRRGVRNGGFISQSGHTSIRRLIGCGLAILMVGLAFGGTARANTITVYSLVDASAAGTCSLRDAITAANTKAAVHSCSKGNGTDTIVFNTGLSGTINLTSTLPAIVNSLTIQGTATNPPAITISGQNSYEILVVNSGATLNLSYLTIEDGKSTSGGAAVDNDGTLTVDDCSFSGNNAVAPTALGTTQGGAILNDGTLVVGNSTFSANRATLGGAIFSDGTASVINTTFADNTGLEDGGGIYIEAGKVNVVSTTFADNIATLGTGGSIYNDIGGKAKVKESILASPSGGNCGGDTADINDQNNNLYDDPDGIIDSLDGSCPLSSGNSQYVSDSSLDLGTLGNNGGPTNTVALGTTSVAINLIKPAQCNYIDVNPCANPIQDNLTTAGSLLCDQRGVVRPQGAGCDAGAYELQDTIDLVDFSTGLIVFPNQFAAGGSFSLPGDATFDPSAISPENQPVTITIFSAGSLTVPPFGPLGVTIPPGSFKLAGGQYKYSGTIDGIKYGVTILAPVDGVYQFTFAAFGVDVTGISNPVSVTLQIGPYIGTDDDVDAAIL